VRAAAARADRLDQRLELLGVAPRHAGDEAAGREALRDRAAGRVAGADDERHRGPVVVRHGVSSLTIVAHSARGDAMASSVEFFFDVGSPTAYLAWTQLPRSAPWRTRTLVFRPMLLGGVFQATGNSSPVTVPAKGRYMNVDIARHAQRYGVPLTINPHFPINTLTLMRAAAGVQLRQPERFDAYLRASSMRCGCIRSISISRPRSRRRGRPAASIRPRHWRSPARPRSRTRCARRPKRRCTRRFGAPTMFVGEQMFFGQDRLEFVREALRR
jgi:2-hydroxychromene-2-carboxylate isomerase